MQTQQKILDAAAAEFAKNGFSQARLSDISEAAGIHLSGFYYYFDTKEALAAQILLQVPTQTTEVIKERLASLPPDAGHRQKLSAAIEGHLQNILKNDNYIRASLKIAQEAPPDIRQQSLEITRKESDLLRDLMEAAHRDGAIRNDIDLTMARMILFGAMNWSIEWFRTGRLSPQQYAEEVVKVIFDGIAAQTNPPPRTDKAST